MRDPNKFYLQENCSGCNRLWNELLKQDAVSGHLRSILEEKKVHDEKPGEEGLTIVEWLRWSLGIWSEESETYRAMSDIADQIEKGDAKTWKKMMKEGKR